MKKNRGEVIRKLFCWSAPSPSRERNTMEKARCKKAIMRPGMKEKTLMVAQMLRNTLPDFSSCLESMV